VLFVLVLGLLPFRRTWLPLSCRLVQLHLRPYVDVYGPDRSGSQNWAVTFLEVSSHSFAVANFSVDSLRRIVVVLVFQRDLANVKGVLG